VSSALLALRKPSTRNEICDYLIKNSKYQMSFNFIQKISLVLHHLNLTVVNKIGKQYVFWFKEPEISSNAQPHSLIRSQFTIFWPLLQQFWSERTLMFKSINH